MSHSNGIIKAPVDLVGDVAAVLGVATYDVGYLCGNAHGQINKWARYKPIRHTSNGELKDQQFADQMFGLSPGATFSGVEGLVAAVEGGTFAAKCGWTYEPPRPGTDWCRLTDFNGYNANATSPFGEFFGFERELSSDSNSTLVIAASAPLDEDSDTTVLHLKDFNSGTHALQNWYFGVLLYYNKDRHICATATKTFYSADVWEVDMGYVPAAYAGEWKAYPFLSSASFTAGGSKPACSIVGIGNPGVVVKLKSPGSGITITCSCTYRSRNSGKVSYTVSVTNNTATERSFTNLTLFVASNASNSNSVTLVSFGTVTVAKGSGWTKSGEANPGQAYGFFRYAMVGYGTSTTTPWVEFEANDDNDG